MKLKKKIIIAALVIAAASGSLPVGRIISDRRLFSKSEDEIYAQMKKVSSEKLVKIINRYEKKLPSMPDKTALLPFYAALMEKAGDFSEEQLIALIQDKDTRAGIETVLVKMYAADGYDSAKIRPLLDDPALEENTKACIVSNCDFSADELCGIFRDADGLTAATVMKKIAVTDSAAAMQLVDEFVKSGDVSDEKYSSVCLGIAQYYEEHQTPEDIETMHTVYIPMLKQIYAQNPSSLVKDQAVYAMARICDYELFTWLIENEKIDDTLKVSVIERNYRLMLDQIAKAESPDDIRAVTEAMRLHPILEIGDALQAAVDQGRLSASDELRSVIADTQKYGIHAVDKYEK